MQGMTESEHWLFGPNDHDSARPQTLLPPDIFLDIRRLNTAGDAQEASRTSLVALDKLHHFQVNNPNQPPRALVREAGIFIGTYLRYNLTLDFPEEQITYTPTTPAGQSPYHTVYDYAPLTGPYLSFTNTPQELAFQEAVRAGTISMTQTAIALENIHTNGVTDPKSEALAKRAMASYTTSVNSITAVIRSVGGEFFARSMRPFFNPLRLNDRSYDAPGGSQLPQIFIDQILFACDLDSQDFRHHHRQNLCYLPTVVQAKTLAFDTKPSLLSLYEEAHRLGQKTYGLDHLKDLVATIYSMRRAHLRLASDSFSHRNQGAKGSGGQDPTFLDSLTDITHLQLQRAKKLLDPAEK